MTKRDEKRETEWVDRVEFRLLVDNKVSFGSCITFVW